MYLRIQSAGDDDTSAVTVFGGEATWGAARPLLSSGWEGRKIKGKVRWPPLASPPSPATVRIFATPRLAHHGRRRAAWDDEEEAEEAKNENEK